MRLNIPSAFKGTTKRDLIGIPQNPDLFELRNIN